MKLEWNTTLKHWCEGGALRQLSRQTLRELALCLGIPRGQNKKDTLRNLRQAEQPVRVILETPEPTVLDTLTRLNAKITSLQACLRTVRQMEGPEREIKRLENQLRLAEQDRDGLEAMWLRHSQPAPVVP